MIETVLVVIVLAVMLVVTVYLGWNLRRIAQMTNMNRYVAWERVTPGSPGPDPQYRQDPDHNPRLNNAFFGLNNDVAIDVRSNVGSHVYLPVGHEELRDRQTDEAFSYLEQFLEDSRKGISERFSAEHALYSIDFDPDQQRPLEFRDEPAMTNSDRHSRLNGDWRYVNGIRYRSDKDRWDPAGYRSTPANALREVFFIDYDDAMDNLGNQLADRIRDFYRDNPVYIGPDIDDEPPF